MVSDNLGMDAVAEHATNTPLIEGLTGAIANPETWWKPGFCPNPKGRGKNSKPRLQKVLEQALRRKFVDMAGVKVPSMVALVNTAIDEAIAGNSKFAKLIFDAAIPKPEVNRNVTINNHVLSHATSNQLIDESVLTAPIESRAEPPLLEEPPPQLDCEKLPNLTPAESNNEQ